MGIVHCNLRVLMAEKGLNIQKVKDKTTLSRTTISNLYNNYGSGVQFDTIVQLCELLQCQPGDLFIYVDIKVDFEDITKELILDESYVKQPTGSNEGVESEILSEVTTSIDIRCHLEYEGIKKIFDFFINISAELNEDRKVSSSIQIIDEKFKSTLNTLKLPYYAKEYIDDKLDEFITDRIEDSVSQRFW